MFNFGEVKWTHIRVQQTEEAAPEREKQYIPSVSILSGGQNRDVAKAFAVWLADGGVDLGQADSESGGDAVAGVAVRVMRNLLQGKAVGADHDPEMVEATVEDTKFSPLPLPARDVQTNVTSIQVSNSSAVLALRSIVCGPASLEVVHALMVLRRDGAGRWLVLQISLNLAPDLVLNATRLFEEATSDDASVHRNEGSQLLGIAQATADDDTRRTHATLWWDNLGGATLQVVEWQPGNGVGTNLFFAPDTESRLKTEAAARFAREPGPYRWRVWSVGADGTIVLSPWRTLHIVAR